MKRREFIGTTTASLVAAELSWALPAEHKLKAVGVQLYTVRDAMKSDFDGTVAKVAQIGYQEVEFAGYFDHSAKDIRALLDKNGLRNRIKHTATATQFYSGKKRGKCPVPPEHRGYEKVGVGR